MLLPPTAFQHFAETLKQCHSGSTSRITDIGVPQNASVGVVSSGPGYPSARSVARGLGGRIRVIHSSGDLAALYPLCLAPGISYCFSM